MSLCSRDPASERSAPHRISLTALSTHRRASDREPVATSQSLLPPPQLWHLGLAVAAPELCGGDYYEQARCLDEWGSVGRRARSVHGEFDL